MAEPSVVHNGCQKIGDSDRCDMSVILPYTLEFVKAPKDLKNIVEYQGNAEHKIDEYKLGGGFQFYMDGMPYITKFNPVMEGTGNFRFHISFRDGSPYKVSGLDGKEYDVTLGNKDAVIEGLFRQARELDEKAAVPVEKELRKVNAGEAGKDNVIFFMRNFISKLKKQRSTNQ